MFAFLISFLRYLFGFQDIDSYQPQQIHLSWTENEGEMRLTWVTYAYRHTYVTWREILCNNSELNDVWQVTPGDGKWFDEGENKERLQQIHTAVVKKVRKECKYQYMVGDGENYNSEIFQFSGRTPDYQDPYDDLDPVKMIVFGDWGIGPIGDYTQELLNAEAISRDFDGVLHYGDFAYDLYDEDGERGDIFLRRIQPIAANFAYMTIPGNHENHQNATHYKARFKMPKNEANEGTSTFFSFDMGPAHFIMFNTEPMVKGKQEETLTQINWLKEDLQEANANRKLRPWIIAASHHPLYCSVDYRKSQHHMLQSYSDCAVDTSKLRPLFEDIFYENNVDLFIQAHVHNYERTTPIYKNQTLVRSQDDSHHHMNPKATIYITSGNAGNSHGHNDPISATPQDWSVYSSEEYGYGRLTVFNKTHLHFEQFSSMQLTEIDHVWIVKTF